jgi:hypothetical protein
MTVTVFTPERRTPAIDLGNRRWRKQLLPVGSISYLGNKIEFTREYLSDLAKSFHDKAFDQVPFQLADGKNSHTNDPERFRGAIVGVELTDDGLDVILEPTEKGEEVLRENPYLGVSARIYENYERSDGKGWRAALQHVLGTLDPHITGMRSWQEVAALSNTEGGTVIDLSDSQFDAEEVQVAKKDKLKAIIAKMKEGGDGVQLSDDELDLLLEITDGLNSGSEDESELTDDELDRLIAEADEDESEEDPEEDEDEEDESEGDTPEPVKATKVAARNRGRRTQIELANAALEQQTLQLTNLQQRLDRQSFETEKVQLANKFGIPPYIAEKARPLLEGEPRTINLANGDEVDASAVMRDVLHAFGNQIKVLDLGNLIGNGLPEDDDEKREAQAAAKDTEDFLSLVRSQYTF